MTWQLMQLNKPVSAMGSAGNLSVLTADPFNPNAAEQVGGKPFLSFPNAVEFLAKRVNGSGQALGIAFAARSLADLSSQLADFNAVFPVPYFAKVQRRAEKLQTLDTDKFELVPFAHGSNALNLNALPAMRNLFIANAIQQSQDSIAAGLLADPVAELDSFVAKKAAAQSNITSLLANAGNDLAGQHGWLFNATSNIASTLRIGCPGHEFTQSAIMLVEGTANDLAYLREAFTPHVIP